MNHHSLRAAHQHLKRDRTIDLELGSLDQLLEGDGRHGPGIDVIAGILGSALRLPDALVVRVALPGWGAGGAPEPDAEAWREQCRIQADEAWIEAMTLRQGGIRELPRALLLSIIAAAIGVVSGYLAQTTSSTLLMVLLYAVAFIAVVAAWTIGWTPIEQATFDWRAPGHVAAAYDLLSRARLEIVAAPVGSGASPAGDRA